MKNGAQSRDTYHHGDLPETLIVKGAALLAEKGIDGFSMREVARRAGVAVAAPAHHFGNAKGLLTAIATEGFSKLAARLALAASTSDDPEAQVVAMCRAYVEMGAHEPGYTAIMFRLDLLDDDDQEFRAQSFHAFGLLRDALTQAAAAHADATQISYAAKMLWSAMHGLHALKMIKDEEAEELIGFAVHTLLAGIR